MQLLKPAAILHRTQQAVGKLRQLVDGLHPDDVNEILLGAVQTFDSNFQIVVPVQGDDDEEENDYSEEGMREGLAAQFTKGVKSLTSRDFERSFKTTLEKGDPQGMRLLALMAGIDLSDGPKQQAGDGARLIIIRPHPDELTPEQETDVVNQIAAACSVPLLPPVPQ